MKKILGVVQRVNEGRQIASVKPLMKFQQGDWHSINTQEFPPRGLVFWPSAQAAIQDALIIFQAQPINQTTSDVSQQDSRRDQYRVTKPEFVCEVFDLRSCGTTAKVRVALTNGVQIPGPVGDITALIWCEPGVFVGPVKLNRSAAGMAMLVSKNLSALTMYDKLQVLSIEVDNTRRMLRVGDAVQPSGYVDWDEDAAVLRRALEIAATPAAQAAHSLAPTKKQVKDAAHTLAVQGGPLAQLKLYRLARALPLLERADLVAQQASELVNLLREHPVIEASLNALRTKVQEETEQRVRAELTQKLSQERAELEMVSQESEQKRQEIEAHKQELGKLERQLDDMRSKVETAGKEIQTAVDASVRAALDKPLELLAQVSVLRPLLGRTMSAEAGPTSNRTPTALNWAHGDTIVKDKVELRRSLTNAARARGVDPSLMLQVHAAVVARLMPMTLGPAALAALAAYADAVCAGRLLIVHVSPSAIHPHDFDELPTGGLRAAASAANDIDGLSLVVFEGANRAPLEASLVPLLQLTEAGLSPFASACGLRLSASLVAGATTVPVTPEIWSYAAAIYAEPCVAPPLAGALPPGDMVLSSGLLMPGAVPEDAINALLENWPGCKELRPVMLRLGAALASLYTEDQRITDALLHGLILPYVATALSPQEQDEAVAEAGGVSETTERTLHYLRRRLT